MELKEMEMEKQKNFLSMICVHFLHTLCATHFLHFR